MPLMSYRRGAAPQYRWRIGPEPSADWVDARVIGRHFT